MADRVGIVEDWRRHLRFSDEEFVVLERISREKRKEKEEGVRGLFKGAESWRRGYGFGRAEAMDG
jgi:hypothetical protein